jgi:uncharacterized repeat protein (TIGR03803 family)
MRYRKFAAAKGIPPVAAAGAVLALAAALVMPAGGARGASEAVLYSFDGPVGGVGLQGPLIADAAGALYGTTGLGGVGATQCCGTVFKLTPPAAPLGRWTETILHRFTGGSDGAAPGAWLVADPQGDLFGTTADARQGNGTVFRLKKPARPGGAWALTVLYTFAPGGDTPLGGLIRDSAGVLYGTIASGGSACVQGGDCGTVFKLTPPANAAGSWTESVLHRFAGGDDNTFPQGPLLAGTGGKLYGTRAALSGLVARCPPGCGTVFELDPPAGAGAAWTERVLYRFKGGSDGSFPTGGLVARAGSLYGTTAKGGAADCSDFSGCGTVFRLTPPATNGQPWTETVLYRFQGRNDGAFPNPLTYRNGVFYGTTGAGGASKYCPPFGCGSVFALTPPTAGAVWTEKVIYSFKGFTRTGGDGLGPSGALLAGQDGRFYGVTSSGGANGDGTVFAIVP